MTRSLPGGYMGRLLRVDLSNGRIWDEEIDAELCRRWVGGVGFGAKYLYEEVPPGVAWDHPDNRLMFFSGPLGGTRVACSGTYCVVTKGPMTNMAGSSQANGYFGAFLKSLGYDGIIVQGRSDRWVYLLVRDGQVELRDAAHLVGTDTWEMDDRVKQELGVSERQASVAGIGPAGEHLVRFALVANDKGHVAAHNGMGAVMGAKRLKAIALLRGRHKVPVHDPQALEPAAKALFEHSFEFRGGYLHKWGTGGVVVDAERGGWLPIKNYLTCVFPEAEKISGQYLRTHFERKNVPCWACRMNHCGHLTVTEGPYKGYTGEEPEYEGMAAMGSAIYCTDPGAALYLSDLTDRLGFDVNEAGWVVGWVMECYEKGILTREQLDGLDMTWGNHEAAAVLLRKIAHREGVGNLLAEGVMRAAEAVGGDAPNCAIYTKKGASPRGHDHRGRWSELLDTCFGNTSTIEATFGGVEPERYGFPPVTDRFDWKQVSTANAQVNGVRQFDDCLGVCRFCMREDPEHQIACVNAVTGWNLTLDDVFTIGRRIVNQLRVFNFRHGLRAELEEPSPRYGSAPPDGAAYGTDIRRHWADIKRNYYTLMGWHPETGVPLPETLRRYGLEHLIPDVEALGLGVGTS